MKKFLIIFYTFSLLFFFGGYFNFVITSDSLNAYLFYGEGCPHCAKEKAYLETIKDKYPGLEIVTFEVYYNQENLLFFKKLQKS